MLSLTRSQQTWLLVAVVSGALAAPLARAESCPPTVASGFAGDLNATYDSGGGAGGDGAGGDGGAGGAGAGAGEGKVLGGLMTMTRLSDGALLGSAVTDASRGLVTIKPCRTDFPVLLTLTGQAGAKYFDEGTNQLTDFGPSNVLHALIDTFDENVGVSPLTEAAYRYALNNFIRDPQQIRAGTIPLAASGNVTGLTLAQVKAANAVVLSEINRQQTIGMKLTTAKSLPTPIDSQSPGDALPNNRYGVAAAVLGGLAAMGKGYVATNASPALATGEQFARDLTDGKLDGFGLDGLPASGAGPVNYDAVRFPIAASVGANAIGLRFGATSTLSRATTVTERTSMAGGSWTVCSESDDAASLLKDGSVTVARTNCSNVVTTLPNFATQVRLIEGSGDGETPRTFFVRNDGTVWGWGDTLCGLLGNGDTARKFKAEPVQLTGLKDVTSIGIGSWFSLARDATGSVYAWGINYIGELGMGSYGPPGAFTCTNDYTAPQFRISSAIAVPTKIAGLSDIVTVAVNGVTAFALDRGGNLYRWGLIATGYNFTAPEPYFGEYLAQTVPALVPGLPKVVAIASSYYMAIALAADGTLWGFGPNIIGNFGDGTLNSHLTPAPVPGISNVVEIAGMKESPFVALLQDGTIRYWGGCCAGKDQTIPAYIRKTPTAPVPGSTPFFSAVSGNSMGTLPPIRHLKASGDKVLLYAVDGSLYEFPKAADEQVFVAVADPGSTPGAGTKTTAVEYYYPPFDHYFITAIADEITKLDNGTFAGWQRTGATVNVFADAPAGSSPVCRFFSTSFAPKSSHFYTPDQAECTTVKASPDWQFEAVVFNAPKPDGAGNCAAGFLPVYRMYNQGQGAAPNHRYTTSLATRSQMLGQGWIPEGYGSVGVIMCAPQ